MLTLESLELLVDAALTAELIVPLAVVVPLAQELDVMVIVVVVDELKVELLVVDDKLDVELLVPLAVELSWRLMMSN